VARHSGNADRGGGGAAAMNRRKQLTHTTEAGTGRLSSPPS
jgi:hypothetical protein